MRRRMGESRRLGDESISLLGDLLRATGDLLREGETLRRGDTGSITLGISNQTTSKCPF